MGRLKREFYKKGEKKGDQQQKRNGGLPGTAVRLKKRWNEGEIYEIRGNREELFLD